ncbi:MAG: hypothetical protein EBZ49_00860 [Proteobacteria bacterium]|nr:hypothetical protein [Pseudomonadota bacterium]
MAFQVSPGVNISEVDLTTVVPAVSTSVGAVAGVFKWGPVEKRTLIGSEVELVSMFGKPTNHNPETFFTAANFLAYGNSLYVVRAANTTNFSNGVISAVANTGSVTNAQMFTVKNDDVYDSITFSDTDVLYVARYPGDLGNSLKVSVCDSVDAFSKSINISNGDANLASGSISVIVGDDRVTIALANSATGTLAEANTRLSTVLGSLTVNDVFEVGNSSIGKQYLKITALNIASLSTSPLYLSFVLGQDGDNENDVAIGTIIGGYDLFASAEDVDVSLVMTGKSKGGTNGEQLSNYLVDNIAEARKDCIVLTSPEKADVVNNSARDESDDTVTFRNSCRSSSYLVIDSGYKYQYDKYNDL